ncbi:MAG: aldehyde dehydrogenase family protein [Verrucomicrobiota bacterium]
MTHAPAAEHPSAILKTIGLQSTSANSGLVVGGEKQQASGEPFLPRSAIDGQPLAEITLSASPDLPPTLKAAKEAFHHWRLVPSPARGELVGSFGDRLREETSALSALIAWEVGKLRADAEAEVHEVIALCDHLEELSRHLSSESTISERSAHRVAEQWYPLGIVGLLTSFRNPVASWSQHALLALICGNSTIWKPSEKAPLCALACHELLASAACEMSQVPPGLFSIMVGGKALGMEIASSPEIPLVCATGRPPMGRAVGAAVSGRLGHVILTLRGNNSLIVTETADLHLAVPTIIRCALDSAAYRSAPLHRIIVHDSIKDELLKRLVSQCQALSVGNPLEASTQMGPLIDKDALHVYEKTLEEAQRSGGVVHHGGRSSSGLDGGAYVSPAVVEVDPYHPLGQQEARTPMLILSAYRTLEEAIQLQNSVPQSHSSAIFTGYVQEAEVFCGPAGSDAPLVNVNTGPSNNGGHASGAKSGAYPEETTPSPWQSFMRRAMNTISYSESLPIGKQPL